MFGHSKINKQYVLMCEGAKDIQLAWVPKRDDQVKAKGLQGIQILTQHVNDVAYFESKQNAHIVDCIWIPTQYQLETLNNTWRITWQFQEFIHNGLNKYLKLFKSSEELWLAFLMYKISNKLWTGKIWISKI